MIQKTSNEQETLTHALHALEREAGLRLKIKKMEAKIADKIVDAVVTLEPGKQTLLVEIKKWAQQVNIGALINQIKQLPGEGMLVADYVNPGMAGRLREQQIQFIDTAGNAYIDQPPTYVYIKGNRPEKNKFIPAKEGAKRAFEPTGLKVIYAFLRNPELVNAPYREIAIQADVALGTVGWVINGLKAAEYIRDKGRKRGRRLVQYQKLLNRWVEVWPEKLKPKQFIGEFIADDPNWWKAINIQAYEGYWGGEIAAAKYTEYLKPKDATVYLPKRAHQKLLRVARLRKATARAVESEGRVLIYQPFWPAQPQNTENDLREGLVHPVLVYADLIATGDPRNLEVAGRIFDEHIDQYCRED